MDLESQLIPATFAHEVHHLVDHLDLSAFDAHCRNDDAGALAHAPGMLLKVVPLAYSQGLVRARLAQAGLQSPALNLRTQSAGVSRGNHRSGKELGQKKVDSRSALFVSGPAPG